MIRPFTKSLTVGLIVAAMGTGSAWSQSAFLAHVLVSDVAGLGEQTDPNLLDPWGVAIDPGGPFVVANGQSALVTAYNSTGAVAVATVSIPSPPGGTSAAAPTAIVVNGTSDFLTASNTPAQFLVATANGTIAAWSSGASAILKIDHSGNMAAYTALALGASQGSNFLYAANFSGGRIEVFDGGFSDVTGAFPFNDPNLPAGFAPFGLCSLGGSLYVTYAVRDGTNVAPGAGNGLVDVFDASGRVVTRFASNGALNAPWGVAVAPPGFGAFGGALLVGNFGDGRINAFDFTTGSWLGSLPAPTGEPLTVPGLRGLVFGQGGEGGDTNALYFTASIPAAGNGGRDGEFGRIAAVTNVYLTGGAIHGNSLFLTWASGDGPYLVSRKSNLADTNWMDLMTVSAPAAIVASEGAAGFFRVASRVTVTPMPFTAALSGAAEIPPVSTAATGLGVLTLESGTLTFHIAYSGLSGPVTGASLRGPASSTNAAATIVALGPLGDGTTGSLAGSIRTTSWSPTQLTALKSGRTYVNLLTAANPGGELRGQVAPALYSTPLTGSAQVPPVVTPGSGAASFVLIGNQLNCTVTWTNLLGPAVTAHIHGPATASNTAPVFLALPAVGGTSGSVSGSILLTPEKLGSLIDVVNAGLAYVNLHSVTNLSGELRGQILP